MARTPVVQKRIIELLQERHTLSAPGMVEALEESGSAVNKTSVYRALDRLLADGQVCRQTFSGDIPLYELRDHHHDHLVCEVCGKVQVSDCLTHLPSSVEGFEVDHHHLTVYGRCAACQTLSVPEAKAYDR